MDLQEEIRTSSTKGWEGKLQILRMTCAYGAVAKGAEQVEPPASIQLPRTHPPLLCSLWPVWQSTGCKEIGCMVRHEWDSSYTFKVLKLGFLTLKWRKTSR